MTRPAIRQIGRWEWVVAGLGVVLVGLLWAPWYGYPSGHGIDGTYSNHISTVISYYSVPDLTAWQAFSVTDIAIAIFALACVIEPFVLRGTRSPAVALTWNVCINYAAIGVIIWITVQLFNTPAGYEDLQWGAWASLGVALATLAAGWMSLTDEHVARAPEPDVPLRPIPPVGGSEVPAPR